MMPDVHGLANGNYWIDKRTSAFCLLAREVTGRVLFSWINK